MKKAQRKPHRPKPLRVRARDDALRLLMQCAQDTNARLARIERLLFLLVRAELAMESDLMALKATDQALINEVHRNTNVSKAAVTALTTLQGNVADLTQKLADAIANSDASDDADVLAALAELKTNNDSTAAATPQLAVAIANTDPNAPAPSVAAG